MYYHELGKWFVYSMRYLCSCHEKATVVLYLRRIRTRLAVVLFQVYTVVSLTSFLVTVICCLFEATNVFIQWWI